MGAEPLDSVSPGQLCQQEEYPFERGPQTQRQLLDVLWGVLVPTRKWIYSHPYSPAWLSQQLGYF